MGEIRKRMALFVECWKRARHRKVAALMLTLITAYGFYAQSILLARLPAWADPEKWPKIPLPWFIVIVLGVLLWITLEGSYQLIGGYDPLRMKLLSLGSDLFDFLREAGPEPKPPSHASFDEAWSHMEMQSIPYTQRIQNGYSQKFKGRAEGLFLELERRHIKHDLSFLQSLDAEWVRKMAAECFMVSARMEIEKRSKDYAASSAISSLYSKFEEAISRKTVSRKR